MSSRDYTPWYWVTKDTEQFTSKGYLEKGQTVQERGRDIANHAEAILKSMCIREEDKVFFDGYADKFLDYYSRGFYSLASPVLSNFGRSGLPISCNGVDVPDSVSGIGDKLLEVLIQTKQGAGTSGFFGKIRPRGSAISTGGYSDGPVHFLQLFETGVDVTAQGTVRRGAFAAYLPVEHPDAEEMLSIRAEGNPIQRMSFGLCIGDDWLNSMLSGDKTKQKLWAKILKKRYETGYPYLFFTDNANRFKPRVYLDKNCTILASNLCTEIMLPSDINWSFVCCLSSLNDLLYDFWKDTDAVEVMTYFLDAVIEEYIRKTKDMKHMEASNKFAREHRAIGIGRLGYHSLLQSKFLAFESKEARKYNIEISRLIDEKSLVASRTMAELFGEPELLKGYGERNATRTAIAPTTSSSFILGAVSPSIEPLASNYFVKDLAKGKFTYFNPFLEELLRSKGRFTPEVRASIREKEGSVQHLTFLTEEERNVFKTFDEISQLEIIMQAADRQQFIDQGQSVNISIHYKTPPSQVSELIITAWQLGLKSLYYQRSTSPAKELKKDLLTCTACEA